MARLVYVGLTPGPSHLFKVVGLLLFVTLEQVAVGRVFRPAIAAQPACLRFALFIVAEKLRQSDVVLQRKSARKWRLTRRTLVNFGAHAHHLSK